MMSESNDWREARADTYAGEDEESVIVLPPEDREELERQRLEAATKVESWLEGSENPTEEPSKGQSLSARHWMVGLLVLVLLTGAWLMFGRDPEGSPAPRADQQSLVVAEAKAKKMEVKIVRLEKALAASRHRNQLRAKRKAASAARAKKAEVQARRKQAREAASAAPVSAPSVETYVAPPAPTYTAPTTPQTQSGSGSSPSAADAVNPLAK